MKKVIFFCSIFLIPLLNSCSNDSDLNNLSQTDQLQKSKDSNQNKIEGKSENLIRMLENKYKINIESNFNINEEQMNSLNNSLFNNIDNNGYKFSINGKEVFAIPFKDNNLKFLLSNFSDFNIILENYVDANGNGNVIITSEDEVVTKQFEKGKLVNIKIIEKSENLLKYSSMTARKSKFRVCFDQAYDDICDGPIGCTAWYTSPLPALTAIAYCTATT
jgi:uncharacterized protein YbcV (DUF1398 family)